MAQDRMSDNPVSWSSKKVQKILYYFMEDTMDKVLKNIQELEIGRYNPNANWEGVGDLERSIHAKIVKNANGNSALVTFFYQNYGRFVEIAVQKNMKYVKLDEMTSMSQVPRSDGKKRNAKPFLHSQIRRQVSKTLTKIGKMYTYAGAAAFWQGVDDPNDKVIHPKNEQSLEALATSLGISNI